MNWLHFSVLLFALFLLIAAGEERIERARKDKNVTTAFEIKQKLWRHFNEFRALREVALRCKDPIEATVTIPTAAMHLAADLMEDLPTPPHTQTAIFELRHAILDLAVDVQLQGAAHLIQEGWNPDDETKQALFQATRDIQEQREEVRAVLAGKRGPAGSGEIVLAQCLEDWGIDKEAYGHKTALASVMKKAN